VSRFYLLLLALIPAAAWGQHVTLRGTVSDASNEHLSLAQIFIMPDSVTLLADEHGRFKVVLATGPKQIQIAHVGVETFSYALVLRRDTTCAFTLTSKINALQEVVVSGARSVQAELFESNRASTNVLTKDIINSIPVLGGEADVIKTLQLLPGTVRGVEGSSDVFVRGGAADQNLVLLDDVPIYNTSHLLGFLSVFNPDVVDRVEAINGGFPAQYGGRLSSILNVQTTSNMADATHVSADVGIIAARLFVEQPIVKDKASFWIAGRRTYIDQVMKALGENLPYYFYDLNGKLTLTPTARDHVSVSFYNGEDVLDFFRDRNGDGDGYLTRYTSGNNSQSLQWQHVMKNAWTSNLSFMHSRYHYSILNAFDENRLVALSDIEDFGGKLIFSRDSVAGRFAVQTGTEWTRHNINPNVINTEGFFSELLQSSATRGRVANEIAAFIQTDWSVAKRWQLSAGVRGSMAIVQGKTYANPEPRFSARYALTENQALKFSYSRMVQYIHRISNSAVSSPTDLWYPVTQEIKPQASHQVAVAWQRSLAGRKAFLSVEGYYKTMNNLIGYEEGTNLFLNNDFESRLIQGKGEAYGVEFLLRKDAGRFTGWVSYTLSWSWRQFDEINQGRWFHARYDRRHNGAVVMQYALSKRWAVSMVWEFISGARFTPVVGQYVVFAPTLTGVDLIPVYSEINSVKMADAHRLDLGLKFRSKPDRKFQWQWFAGMYNTYNRANPIGITIEQDENTGELRYEQPGLFGLIPFISYGFKF
jgi:hypothetical protein